MGVTLSGPGPIGFTWTFKGDQLFIPLSAFELDGSSVAFSSAWSSVFTGTDAKVLLALAQSRYLSGELSPTVPPSPAPAVVFTAASAGVEGNNIAVTIKIKPTGTVSGPPNVVNSSLVLDGTQTDTFPGLASAADAANAIGLDTEPGTGLVQFHGTVPSGSDLPDNQSLPLTDTTPQPVTTTSGGSKSTLFEVVARQGAPLPITVKVDVTGSTFTLTAEYDSGSETVEFSDLSDNLPTALKCLFTVASPASGFAVPAAGTVQLSGGDTGVPASGIAYTSTS